MIRAKKRCKKCGGMMIIEHDEYGNYEHCMICGFVHEPNIETIDALLEEPVEVK